MFGLINTKNLYLVTLDTVKETKVKSFLDITYRTENKLRYALARKCYCDYKDIFSGTIYNTFPNEGSEVITETRVFIGSKKYITKEEAIYALQQLNPTYLDANKMKENTSTDSKKLVKKRNR